MRGIGIVVAGIAALAVLVPTEAATALPAPVPGPTASATAAPRPGPSATATPTPSATPHATGTPIPHATATPKPTGTAMPSPSATPTPTQPPPAGTALALVPLGATTLTLPAGDGFQDGTLVRVLAAQPGAVDLDLVGAKSTVPLDAALPLQRAKRGWVRTVAVPVKGLKAGGWVLRVRRTTDPAVTARTTVRVGSGKPVTVTMIPSARTLYPLRDGVLDQAVATVSATDETGTVLPISGKVAVTIGTAKRTRALVAGAVSLPVTGLALGTAALTATVKGPAGKPVVRAVPLTLAPTGVGALRLSASSDTVQPVVDGLLDSIVLSTRGAAVADSPEPVSGTLSITSGTTVVQTWPVTSGAPAQFTWDGRVGGRIVPGTYLATLVLRGPEGLPRVTSTTIRVSAQHLPYRVRDLFTVAAGNQQGLAVHDGIFYVGFDNGDGTSRIERYDGNGNAFPLTLSPLAIGHAAELSYSTTSNFLYAVNGGSGVPTKVWAIEPQAADGASALRQTIDLSALGDCGMVAVDDANGRLLVFTRQNGTYEVSAVAIDDAVDPATGAAKVLSTTPVQIEGTPQGMEVVGQELWIYTSMKKANHLAQFSLSNGLVADGTGFDVMNAGEGEGLAALTTDAGATIWVGMHGPNRIGVLEPVADETLG